RIPKREIEQLKAQAERAFQELRRQADEDLRHLQMDLQQKLAAKDAEIDGLRREINALRLAGDQARVSEERQEGMLAELARLQRQLSEVEDRESQLQSEVQALVEDREQLGDDLTASKETIARLREELQKERSILSWGPRRFTDFTIVFCVILNYFREEMEHRTSLAAVETAERELKEKDRTIKMLEAALSSSRDDLKKLEGRVGDLMGLVEEERKGAEKRAAEKYSADIRGVRKNSDNTIAVLRARIQKMEAKHKEEVEEIEDRMASLKGENSKLRARLNKVRGSSEAREGEMSVLRAQIGAEQEKVEGLEDKLRDEKTHNKELNRRLAELETEYQRRLASAGSGSKTLDQRLRDLSEKRASLATAEALTQDVEDLKIK
ncbi:hypothetical protein FOL47_011131, partial [Perkinsus chesapeaki]